MGRIIGRVLERYEREGIIGVLTAIFSRSHPIKGALRKISKQQSLSVVQIGAYIGDTDNDPIFGFLRKLLASDIGSKNIKIVLIEPIKEYAEQLQKNYQGCKGVFVENVAIAEEAGLKDFFRLGVDPVQHGFPEWLSQLGSLKAERMTTLWDKYEKDEKLKQFYLKHRVVEKVNCITLQDLLSRHQISQLDLLQIDAEGYDYEILKTIDFARIQPRYINYERILLQEKEPECRALLIRAGYRLRDFSQDTFCTRRH